MVVSEVIMGERIDQVTFLRLFKEYGYDEKSLNDLFDCDHITTGDKIQFNQSLQKINKEQGIDIFDMLIVLEKFFTSSKKIVEFLDVKTFEKLKKEIRKDYFINDRQGEWGNL